MEQYSYLAIDLLKVRYMIAAYVVEALSNQRCLAINSIHERVSGVIDM
jgi:hypothetical protein